MTYRESLQQVKETRTMLTSRYNIFSLYVLDVKICRVLAGVTELTGQTISEAHRLGSDLAFPEVSSTALV